MISVDAKKKELVGGFKNAGRTWRPQGKPKEVSTKDFPSLAQGKALPYGVYDSGQNRAVVNVGITPDTAEFAVESIRRWWKLDGQKTYRAAKGLLISADAGGSNGKRLRAWKINLQHLAVLLDESARSALISATEGCALVGAPSLPWEVGNALVAGVRRRRLSASAVHQAWASYQTVPVRLAEIDAGHALEIALELGLYAHDAYVLETSRSERLPLLTLDGGLARAAQRLAELLNRARRDGQVQIRRRDGQAFVVRPTRSTERFFKRMQPARQKKRRAAERPGR